MRWGRIGSKKLALTLCAILLLGFSLRIQGNTFGLPYFFHPDETKLTTLARTMAQDGSLNPKNFYYPTGFIYLLLLGFKFISFLGLGFHNYQADLILFHWLGRFYSALLGAGAVWLIFAIAKKAYSTSVGMTAALFLSLNFIHIKHSHYATTDIASLFFILLSLFFVCHCTGLRNLIPLAAFFGGIAIGIKYSAWPIIFPFFIVSKKQFIHAIFFCFLGFFLTTPFAIIDLRHFLSSLIEILIIPRSYWLGITHTSPFYYFYDFRPVAGVGGIFIFSILGLFSRLKKWSRYDTILISFFLPYIILTSLSVQKIDRFFLPAIIVFILWAALSLDRIALILSRRCPREGRPEGRRRQYFILFILVIILSFHPLLKAIRYGQRLEEKDTRIKTREWIGENIFSGSHLAVFNHSWANPPIEEDGYKITPIPLVYKNKDRDREMFKLRLARYPVTALFIKKIAGKELSPELLQKRIASLTSLEDFTLFPLGYFKEKDVDYIIISGFFKTDLLDKATAIYFPELSLSAHNFFKELGMKTKLVYSLDAVKEFGPDFALSPSVEIYKLVHGMEFQR